MNFTEPIEIPRGTHYGNNYYAVYSNKIHRECHFFSTLEYYNFLTLEINPFVERFCEQPLKIEIMQDNKIKHAIFDMWVKYRNGEEELQEIKYSSELEGEDKAALRSQEQIRREELWCQGNNMNFVLRTEKTIVKGRFFLDNANVMAARLRRYIPTDTTFYDNRILKALDQHGPLLVDTLISGQLLPLQRELEHLCYMYEKGLINMNIENQPFGGKTEVSLCQN